MNDQQKQTMMHDRVFRIVMTALADFRCPGDNEAYVRAILARLARAGILITAMDKMEATEKEIAALRADVVRLAERLADCSEILGRLAEKRG